MQRVTFSERRHDQDGRMLLARRRKGWVFETPAQLEGLRLRLERFGPVAAYRLNCSLESLEQRIWRRGGHEVQKEIARARELHGILNQAATTGDLGFVVETENMSAREAAQTILRHAREAAASSGGRLTPRSS